MRAKHLNLINIYVVCRTAYTTLTQFGNIVSVQIIHTRYDWIILEPCLYHFCMFSAVFIPIYPFHSTCFSCLSCYIFFCLFLYKLFVVFIIKAERYRLSVSLSCWYYFCVLTVDDVFVVLSKYAVLFNLKTLSKLIHTNLSKYWWTLCLCVTVFLYLL